MTITKEELKDFIIKLKRLETVKDPLKDMHPITKELVNKIILDSIKK